MSIKPIGADVSELFEDSKYTFLSADISSGGSELTVLNIKEFAVNQILMIGELGNEQTEIIKTHSSTAPTGSTITLASNLVFSHLQGAKVYIIDYDQIEFSHADTVAGTKTVLGTEDIESDSVQTIYKDSTESAGYYFVRYKNSIDSSYSDYSDPIPHDGFGTNTVNTAISYAMTRNKTEFTDNITQSFCIEEINDCLAYIIGKLKKWSRLQAFDTILGQTEQGVGKIAVASDMWGYSNKAILGFRIGDGENLVYRDKREWENDVMDGVDQTTLSSGASVGDTDITLTNSYDFDDSGTVMIKGQEITYTANDKSTGVLSGVPASGTGSVTAILSADDAVWQGYSDGEPDRFTVYGGYIYFYPLCDSSNDDQNIHCDYWKEAPSVDSDADTLDISRYRMVKYWLTWAIRCQLKNDGLRDLQDGDYLFFERVLADAEIIDLNTHGQKFKRKPLLNKIL